MAISDEFKNAEIRHAMENASDLTPYRKMYGDSTVNNVKNAIYAEWKAWNDINWNVVYSNERYDKSSEIFLDSTGGFVERIKTIDDGKSTTRIYTKEECFITEYKEVAINNYYNQPSFRNSVHKEQPVKILGNITTDAAKYFNFFQNYLYVLDLLNSNTNCDLDFKGKKNMNEDPNSIIILVRHAMTLRDAGNFLYGYSARMKGYSPEMIAKGAGFVERQNKKGKFDDEHKLPYYGEAQRSANMNYVGFELFYLMGE